MVPVALAGIPSLLLGDSELFSAWWFACAGISVALVVFAGLMSGLTLGLMSLSLVELEVLQQGGTPAEKEQAGRILPVVQKQHQLLVTLLLCNAAAMEALPIFLDDMFNPVIAIVLSVTFVLIFGEVIPQAICSRYGLAVGAYFVWLVRLLMIICYPVAYPVGKILDCILGHNESALFRRAQLKALVTIHSQEAGKGGELTHDEATIISGALDMTEKTAEAAMTPIESIFSLDINSKLDWETIGKILARGHSRVPVYFRHPRNIIGVLLVKCLLTVRPETDTPLSAISIRKMPRVPADMPLYDILNEFQKGSSHMAAVTKANGKAKNQLPGDKKNVVASNKEFGGNPRLNTPLLSKDEKSETISVDVDKLLNKSDDVAKNNAPVLHSTEDVDNDEVVGIITLEDVFEELLQEEIVDETDEFVDVHNRIRVVAAAAASSIARAPSFKRISTPRAMEKIVAETDEYVDVPRIRMAATAAASSLARNPSLQRLSTPKKIVDEIDEYVDVPRIRKAAAAAASSLARAASFQRLSTPKALGRTRDTHHFVPSPRKSIEGRSDLQKSLLTPLIDQTK